MESDLVTFLPITYADIIQASSGRVCLTSCCIHVQCVAPTQGVWLSRVTYVSGVICGYISSSIWHCLPARNEYCCLNKNTKGTATSNQFCSVWVFTNDVIDHTYCCEEQLKKSSLHACVRSVRFYLCAVTFLPINSWSLASLVITPYILHFILFACDRSLWGKHRLRRYAQATEALSTRISHNLLAANLTWSNSHTPVEPPTGHRRTKAFSKEYLQIGVSLVQIRFPFRKTSWSAYSRAVIRRHFSPYYTWRALRSDVPGSDLGPVFLGKCRYNTLN
jgi:hypothetical protein